MKGLKTFLVLILRRDRLKLPLIVIGFVLSVVVMFPMLRDIYGDAESIATMHSTLSLNPAILFLTGPMDSPTFASFMTLETVIWWGMLIAFINTMLIVRHTRHNEEIGAQELLLSGSAHRSTGLVAAVMVAVLLNGLIAIGISIGMQLFTSIGSEQSWLYAISFGAFGFVWAAVATVVVQFIESGRSANGVLAGLIGAAFIVRGIGDFMGNVTASGMHEASWVSWLSPFGWLQATRSLTSPNWEPLIISAATSIVAIGLAVWLLERRDVGSGLLPSHPGRARASWLLMTPIGLTLKLQKGIFIGWLIGILVMIGTIGALVPQMSGLFDSSSQMTRVIASIGGTGALIPAFMSAMITITSLMVFAYAIQGLMRLRSEESLGHLENILATTTSRLGWLGRHAGVVMYGGVVLLVVVGGGLALLTNAMSSENLDMWQYTLAGLSYTPILLIFVGLYVLLFGIWPRFAGLITWSYFGFVAFMTWIGPILQVDERLMSLSVIHHITAPPSEDIELAPLIVIALVSVTFMIIGMIGWRRRNLLEK